MNDDDLTTDLGRELHGRSEAMHGSSLALADVRQRARSIRRRRTATAVGGAVAAIALIVPTASIASHQRPPHLPAPARHAEHHAQSEPYVDGWSAATDRRARRVRSSDGLLAEDGLRPRRKAPHPGGLSYPVRTRYTPGQLVELMDGAKVWRTTDRNGTSYVEIQDTDGTFHDPVRIESDLSVNSAHSIVGWLTPSGQVTIWEGWASEPRPLGDPVPGHELRMGPITGSADAVPGQPGPAATSRAAR